jgi:hypothetical protein
MEQIAPEPSLRDIGQFLAASAASKLLDPEQMEAIDGALDGAVLGSSMGAIREQAGQIGLHVELSPASLVTDQRLDAYGQNAAAWAESSGWGDLLGMMVSLSDTDGPQVTAELIPEAKLPTLGLSVADADAADVRIQLGLLDPELPLVYLFGLVGAGNTEPEAAYEFEWTGDQLLLGDEATAQDAFVFSWVEATDEGGELVPAVLGILGLLQSSDGEEVTSVLLFSDGDESSTVVVLLEPQPTTLTLSQIRQADPSAMFVPLIPTVDVDTGAVDAVTGKPVSIPEDGAIPLTTGPALAGDYALFTTARDVWGNETPVVSDTIPIGKP